MNFDQYQRYKTTQIIIEMIKKKNGLVRTRVLEIGSNGDFILEGFLTDDEIIFSNPEVTNSERCIIVNGCDMGQFEDDSMDFIVALDVLEHVEDSLREQFILEINRVAKYAAIISFPNDSEENRIAERRINNYYKALYGIEHKWLQEHIENGLPDIEKIKKSLDFNKVEFELIKHGSIDCWKKMMKALFSSYASSDYSGLMQDINEYYEKKIYYADQSENCYRVILAISKDGNKIKGVRNYLDSIFSFIIEEKDREYFDEMIDEMKRLGERKLISKEKRIYSKLYFDYGNGYSEENIKLIIAQSLGNDEYRIKYELNSDEMKKLKKIRLDPIEDQMCIIENVTFRQGDCYLKLNFNQPIQMKTGILLDNYDPMVSAEVSEGEAVEIVCLFQIQGESFWNKIMMNQNDTLQKLEEKNKLLQESKRINEELSRRNRLVEEEMNKAENKLNDLILEHRDLLSKKVELAKQKEEIQYCYEKLKQQNEILQRDYKQIIDSICWKLTKPIRIIGSVLLQEDKRKKDG